MTQEQNMPSEPLRRQGRASAHLRERQERRRARRAARAERRAAHAQRSYRDWTFEVQAGEKAYTFTWHWHTTGLQAQVAGAAESANADLQTQSGQDAPAASQ
jgi:hypothetical protein